MTVTVAHPVGPGRPGSSVPGGGLTEGRVPLGSSFWAAAEPALGMLVVSKKTRWFGDLQGQSDISV